MRSKLVLSGGFRAAVAAGLVAAATLGRAQTFVVVDVRTDYRPFEEFVQVEAALHDDAGTVVASSVVPAFSSQDWNAGGGRRVGEFANVPPAVYDLRITLRDGSFAHRARHLTRFRVNAGSAQGVTVGVWKPQGEARKTVALALDRDGDGRIGAGDTVRYEVTLAGSGGSEFRDELRNGLRLVPGSVTTTHGTVAIGNGPADELVLVTGLGLTGVAGDAATVRFDAEVAPVIENQGRFRVATSADAADYWTDDPATPELGDATITPVACDAASLAKELSACQAARKTLEAEVAELEGRLAALEGDADEDGVANAMDRCDGTGKGLSVDDRGCGQAQFCAGFDVTTAAGRAVCRRADWRGDEPLTALPGDCRPRAGLCEAQ